jgi:hypothetical protein
LSLQSSQAGSFMRCGAEAYEEFCALPDNPKESPLSFNTESLWQSFGRVLNAEPIIQVGEVS